MACRWVAVPWTPRRAQVRVWFFSLPTPTASAASPSSTVPIPTSTCHQKLCPAIHPLPATCEYSTCGTLIKWAVFAVDRMCITVNRTSGSIYSLSVFCISSTVYRKTEIINIGNLSAAGVAHSDRLFSSDSEFPVSQKRFKVSSVNSESLYWEFSWKKDII